MKHRQTLKAILLLTLTTLGACQMEEDIRGKIKGEERGYLEIKAVPQENEPLLKTRVEKSYDIHTFPVTIVNKDTYETRTYDTYQELCDEGKIALEQGSYEFKIWQGNGELQVQREPYFEGKKDFKILLNQTTKVQTVCRSMMVKVGLVIEPSFLDYFKDDYSVSVTNGRGVLFFNKQETADVYLRWQPDDRHIEMTVKATNKTTGQVIQKKYELKKPADQDGGLLVPGDVWAIKLNADAIGDGEVTNPSKAAFDVVVDLTMNETGLTVDIPVDHIIFDETVPEDGDTSAEAPALTPAINGNAVWKVNLGEVVNPTVQVQIAAPKNIRQLQVNIVTDNEAFAGILASMGMDAFDFCNVEVGSTTEDNLKQLGFTYNDAVKGKDAFLFDISSFMGMIVNSGLTGNHQFQIKVVDGAGMSAEGTLVVVAPAK